MAELSIVIRCHNEERHIGRLLEGICQQTKTDVEIIVVDSGSTDATVSIAREYPTRILTIAPEEFSFGRSLNEGCRAATAPYLVFASAHVYPVHRDWLERLVLPFSDPKVALVYGMQRGNELTKYSEHQVFGRWFPAESNLHQTHPFCNNANAAVRREIWNRQPYDESLTGLEDLDWAKRVLREGYHLAYAADAGVVHVHEETSRRIYNRYRREAIALKGIAPEEHFHIWDFVRLFVGNTVSDCYHAWHDGRLAGRLWEITMFRLMQFWGTYRGYRHRGPVAGRLKRIFYYPNERVRRSSHAAPADPDREAQYSGVEASAGRVD